MRASGPRSRRPTPRLVPSRPRAGDCRVHYCRGMATLGARAAGPLSPGNRAWRRGCGPAARAPGGPTQCRCSLASAGRRLPGSLLPWNGNLGSAGRWPAFPGEPRLAARMRARRPTPRLVPSHPRAGDCRVHYCRGMATLGARAAGPLSRGTAPGGADAGQRPALPARTKVVLWRQGIAPASSFSGNAKSCLLMPIASRTLAAM